MTVDIDKFNDFMKLYCSFEGWISTDVEYTQRDLRYGFCKFSMALKKTKDDEPVWLNCIVNGSALADEFSKKCQKGSRISISGEFKETEDPRDGHKYLKFYVRMFSLIEKPVPKENDA